MVSSQMATSDQISKYLLCTILRIILNMCFSEFDEKTFSVMNAVWYSRRGNGIINRRASSVQFSRSVVSDSLRPHEMQHARPPCPSPIPRVHSNSQPSSQWCHSAISSSVVPFSSCPQSLPASESFLMSQLFAWGGQSTGVSTLASSLPRPLSFISFNSSVLIQC